MRRDADAAAQLDCWDRMEARVDGEPEAVFLHELKEGKDGTAYAAVINERMGSFESETMNLTLRILEGEELDEIQRLTV